MMNEKGLNGSSLFKSIGHSAYEFGHEINVCHSVPDRVTNFISNMSTCLWAYWVPERGRYFWVKWVAHKLSHSPPQFRGE
jgi:hypothetical protein